MGNLDSFHHDPKVRREEGIDEDLDERGRGPQPSRGLGTVNEGGVRDSIQPRQHGRSQGRHSPRAFYEEAEYKEDHGDDDDIIKGEEEGENRSPGLPFAPNPPTTTRQRSSKTKQPPHRRRRERAEDYGTSTRVASPTDDRFSHEADPNYVLQSGSNFRGEHNYTPSSDRSRHESQSRPIPLAHAQGASIPIRSTGVPHRDGGDSRRRDAVPPANIFRSAEQPADGGSQPRSVPTTSPIGDSHVGIDSHAAVGNGRSGVDAHPQTPRGQPGRRGKEWDQVPEGMVGQRDQRSPVDGSRENGRQQHVNHKRTGSVPQSSNIPRQTFETPYEPQAQNQNPRHRVPHDRPRINTQVDHRYTGSDGGQHRRPHPDPGGFDRPLYPDRAPSRSPSRRPLANAPGQKVGYRDCDRSGSPPRPKRSSWDNAGERRGGQPSQYASYTPTSPGAYRDASRGTPVDDMATPYRFEPSRAQDSQGRRSSEFLSSPQTPRERGQDWQDYNIGRMAGESENYHIPGARQTAQPQERHGQPALPRERRDLADLDRRAPGSGGFWETHSTEESDPGYPHTLPGPDSRVEKFRELPTLPSDHPFLILKSIALSAILKDFRVWKMEAVAERDAPKEGSQPLACPFAQIDPMRHKDCFTEDFSRASLIKDHLLRCHVMPIYCPICMDQFDDEHARDKHIRLDTCGFKRWAAPDGLTESQKRKLQGPSPKTLNRKGLWNHIFDIAFQGHMLPPQSPYVYKPLQLEIRAYREYLDIYGADVLSDVVTFGGKATWNLPDEERDRTALQHIMLKEGIWEMVEKFMGPQHGRAGASDPRSPHGQAETPTGLSSNRSNSRRRRGPATSGGSGSGSLSQAPRGYGPNTQHEMGYINTHGHQ